MATADNLYNMTQNFITPDILQKLSRSLGQPVDKIQTGLKAVLPAFLMGLVNKGDTPEGAEGIVNLVKKEGFDSAPPTPGSVGEETYLQKGNEAVNGIFGNNLKTVTGALSSSTGLNTSHITKMMGLIAPVVMGVLGSKIKRENLNAKGLMRFLGQQKSSLTSFIPAGVAGFFGGASSSIEDTFIKDKKPIYATREGVIPRDTDRKRPWALLGLIALAILAFIWWFSGRQSHDTIFNQSTITSPETSETSSATE